MKRLYPMHVVENIFDDYLLDDKRSNRLLMIIIEMQIKLRKCIVVMLRSVFSIRQYAIRSMTILYALSKLKLSTVCFGIVIEK